MRIAALVTAAATATALLIGTVGCSTAAPRPESAAHGDAATLRWATDPGNLTNGHVDPHRSQADVSAMVGRLVLDSLTYLDADGELHPWLARSWSVNADSTEVTLQLRDDVTFHDGERFDAAAVRANFDHIMADATESAHANTLLGGDLYAGTEVVDPLTVRVRFTEPFAPFLRNASTAFLGMYSPRVLSDRASELASGGADVSVGSGPWIMRDLRPGSGITYDRNPDYAWAPDPLARAADTAQAVAGSVRAERLELSFVPDTQLRAESLRAGELNVATKLTPAAADGLDPQLVHARPAPGVPYSLFLNRDRAALADPDVRRALRAGANTPAAVEAVFLGQFEPAYAALSAHTPGLGIAPDDYAVSFDAARAERLLDAAGWRRPEPAATREKDGVPLRLRWISWTPRDDDAQAVADLLIDDWRRIGVDVTNEVLEPGSYLEAYNGGDFDIVDWGFAGVDPDILRNHLHSGGFQNAAHVRDAEIDRLVNRAAGTSDQAERARLYRKLLDWNDRELAILPLYTPAMLTATAGVTGVVYDANGWPNMTAVHLDRAA